MRTLQKDTKERNLGRKRHICKICGAEGEFPSYLVREMMNGTRDEFEYFVCGSCGCLQIASVPENLGMYYGENYYSFGFKEQDISFETPVGNEMKILDVGCGSGAWLFGMAQRGYGNLYGCDPFLEENIAFGDRARIRKCTIHEMDGEGTFDFIRMSDSFEHMTDPLETLRSVHRLLKPCGILYMSIPIFPNIAFDMFETHWYQLDAPRHIFLHSLKSLAFLEEKSGLKIVKKEYDSNNAQVIRSFFYQYGIPYWEITPELINEVFSDQQIREMDMYSAEVNKSGYGDHVELIWSKDETVK